MSFLGIGVRPPQPSLGSLIADGIDYVDSNLGFVLGPLVVVVILVLSLQLIAQGLGAARTGDPMSQHRLTRRPVRRLRRPDRPDHLRVGAGLAERADRAGRQPEHRGDPGRRPRLRRHRPLRLRDRHAAPRPAGSRRRVSFTELPHHADVLADSGRAAHRAQPAQGRLRLPGQLRSRASRRTRSSCRTTRRRWPRSCATAGYATFVVGKWHLAGDRLAARRGRKALVAVPARLRPLLRHPRRLHQPAPAAPAGRGQLAYQVEELPGRLLPDRRPDRPGDRDDHRAAGGRPRQAVLPLLRPRRGARAAAGQGRRHRRRTPGATTRGWDRSAESGSPRQMRAGLCLPTDTALPPATPRPATTCRRGTSLDDRAAAPVRPLHGGLRGDGPARSTPASAGSSTRSSDSASSTTRSSCSPPTTAATAEGGAEGTRSYFSQFAHVAGLPDDWDRDVDRDSTLIGGPQTDRALPARLGPGVQHPVPALQGRTPSPAASAPR